MKKHVILLFIVFSLISCKEKENDSLRSEFQDIIGIWHTQSVSWDSSGVRVKLATPYDKLIINNDLSYSIFLNIFTPVENGTIDIITQNSDILEVFFAAKYPDYSSFAGSHIFGFSKVNLVSLSGDEMVLRSVDPGFYPNMEFRFRK
jgi:hypothetical protein